MLSGIEAAWVVWAVCLRLLVRSQPVILELGRAVLGGVHIHLSELVHGLLVEPRVVVHRVPALLEPVLDAEAWQHQVVPVVR
ncbi:MAG: hypothetical protein ACPHOJ_07170 [Litorivicinaceae bacterium]